VINNDEIVCVMRKAGALAMLFVVVALAAVVIAEARQPTKVPRIGYLSPNDAVLGSFVPSQFGRLRASVATWKDRTSPPSTNTGRDRVKNYAINYIRR
jgi:hypothetical protein